MKFHAVTVPSLAAVALFMAACQDATPPTDLPSPAELRAVPQAEVPDPDALARTIPGFGG